MSDEHVGEDQMSDDRGDAHEEAPKDASVTRSGEDHLPNSVAEPWATRILVLFGIVCLVSFLLDFVIERETHHPWEEFPGFYVIFGFLGVAGLILLSKELRRIVARSEDYYDVD